MRKIADMGPRTNTFFKVDNTNTKTVPMDIIVSSLFDSENVSHVRISTKQEKIKNQQI